MCYRRPANALSAQQKTFAGVYRQRSMNDRSFNAMCGLPRPANVIDTKLVAVAWPRRRAVKASPRGNTRRTGTATILMMNRVHQILTDTPRIRLPHVGSRWNNQCQRLAVLLIVVRAMPGTVHCEVVRPNRRDSVGIAGCRAGIADSDEGCEQTGCEDESSDHDGFPMGIRSEWLNKVLFATNEEVGSNSSKSCWPLVVSAG